MGIKEKRKQVFCRYGGRCSYCGCDLTNEKWHIDHAEPVERLYERKGNGNFLKGTDIKLTEDHFKDGDIPATEYRHGYLSVKGYGKPENDTIDNMMPACASCNINKHSMNIEEFRRFIFNFVKSLNERNVNYKVAKRYGLIVETNNPVVFYFEKFPIHIKDFIIPTMPEDNYSEEVFDKDGEKDLPKEQNDNL